MVRDFTWKLACLKYFANVVDNNTPDVDNDNNDFSDDDNHDSDDNNDDK